MKSVLNYILLLLLVANVSMAWDETRYDTVSTTWPNGNQKEFSTRYWHMGNEKGFQPHGQYSQWYENGRMKEDGRYNWSTKIGSWIKWSDDGGRTEEAVLINGERHGMYIQWHSERNIKTIGHYKYGQMHGLWTFRKPGDDLNNSFLYTDSVQFYYEGALLVELEGYTGKFIHEENSFYNDELQIWIEWKRLNSIDWLNNYLWFDLGNKIDGKKDGKWIRLNHRGEILEINYFKNGKLIELE
jgi:antitoxin component YwqK of YwqJK toxin-antitoxin module